MSTIGRWHAGSVDNDQSAAINVPEVAGRSGERWKLNPIQCRGMQHTRARQGCQQPQTKAEPTAGKSAATCKAESITSLSR